MIGTFYQPHSVVANTSVLDKLDDRQVSSELAEAIKYRLISVKVFLNG